MSHTHTHTNTYSSLILATVRAMREMIKAADRQDNRSNAGAAIVAVRAGPLYSCSSSRCARITQAHPSFALDCVLLHSSS